VEDGGVAVQEKKLGELDDITLKKTQGEKKVKLK